MTVSLVGPSVLLARLRLVADASLGAWLDTGTFAVGQTGVVADCDLCEAARITAWFYEDDLCWIAECEICAVPMVVWREHDPSPSPEVRTALHERLGAVVVEHFEFEHYVDDNMRNIPDHYHAHARPKGGFFGHGLKRKQP